MGRPKIYPLPVEGLIDNPGFMMLPAAARGILFTLVLHFWQSECRPLPDSDVEKRHIARAHRPTWNKWGAVILSVFDAVRPELEKYYRLRKNHETTLSLAAKRGGQSSAAKRRQKSLAANAGHVRGRPTAPARDMSKPSRNGLADRFRPGGLWND
jgi:uncharacterized protein YdaU (DUF1376 family)